MNATILNARSNDDARLSSRIRAGSHRKSRAFRPTTEAMEQRLQLSAQVVGAATAISGIAQQNPPIIISPIQVASADLAVESVNVQSLGNNQFEVTATLENLPIQIGRIADLVTAGNIGVVPPPAGVTYPGGGIFAITRTDGGTTLSLSSTKTVQATPDPVQTIAWMQIPSLAPGKTIQLSTVTTGRALFTATATPTAPETNPANDSMTTDTLVSHTLPINTATLGAVPALTNAIQNTVIHLDSSNSYIMIPGIVSDQFTIPGKSVSIGVGPFSDTVTYYVNNLSSTSTTLAYEQGGLAVTVNFANNSNALITSSSIAPNIGVTNLQVKVLFPLSYNASGQYLNFNSPQVTVTGNWSANGLLGPVFNLLLPNINAAITSGLTSALQPYLGDLSFQLNTALHSYTTGGRIVSVDIGQDEMDVAIETQS